MSALDDLIRSEPHLQHRQMAARLGLHEDVVRRRRKKLGAMPPVPASEQPSVIEGVPGPRIVTLDELLATARVDTAVWTVERYVVNKWEVGTKGPDGKAVVAPLYQVKAWLVRKVSEGMADLLAATLDDIRAETALRTRVTHRTKAIPESELHAAELDIFDLHIGKLAHSEEVGENYDARIAMECAQDAVRDLLWQTKPYPIEEMILPLGNDFFNSDNLVGTTTGGTRQDTDTRYHLMFRRGRSLASWMIHECAKIAPVRVIIVPGNHDQQTMFDLGEVMDAEFARDPRVTINNTARPRKYHAYGQNLLGFCHGNEEKPGDLPELMATEEPLLWAQSTHREFHIGHFHHGKEKAPLIVDDKRSVTVRWIRSLSGSDRWHAGKGYLGRRGAEGFIYRKTGGLRAHLFTYPEARAA